MESGQEVSGVNKPGMVLETAQRLNLGPARSAFLGDKISDMRAAKLGGIGLPIFLSNQSSEGIEGIETVRNFDQVLEVLERFISKISETNF